MQWRSLGLVGCVIAAVVALAWVSPMPAMVQLLAKTMLVMGGTGHPLVDPAGPGQTVGGWGALSYPLGEPDMAVDPDGTPAGYVLLVHDNYVVPGGSGDEQYRAVAVYTPQEFFPVAGSRTFDDSVATGYANAASCAHQSAECVAHAYPSDLDASGSVIVGYSQSAVIASLVKQHLLDDPGTAPGASFVLLANPMRPNGGLLQRLPQGMTIPVLGVTAYGSTPTNSCDEHGENCAYPTMDVAMQYDALGGDFPIYPLNVLAVANSLAAYGLLHGAVPEQHLDAAVLQGVHGDTTYYMLPTDLVPLLMPFDGLVPRPVLMAIDEPLRVLIETGYRRDISPGEPTPAYLIPVINPVSLTVNLLRSVPVGLDNAVEEITGDRPLGSTDPGLYGVGGDDADLRGLPAGVGPLGSTSPTPTTAPLQQAAPDTALPEIAAVQEDSEPTRATKPAIRRSGPSTPVVRTPQQREEERRGKWRPPIIDASRTGRPGHDTGRSDTGQGGTDKGIDTGGGIETPTTADPSTAGPDAGADTDPDT
ncbi:PE-PPE domain-containing protein [Mycolicibacterium thermoresistibile]